MNSVDRHLTAESKAATLLAMRSAKKEILLVVEGDTDVEIFASVLSLPRSNILSCDGKEMLMLVYGMAPQKGIDAGTVFIRDRDNDGLSSCVNNSALILITYRYDIEMELLENRIFGRIICEFTKSYVDGFQYLAEFEKICKAASYIGAIRIYSQRNNIGLHFDEIKYSRFVDPKDMSVNLGEAIRYIFAKSKKLLSDRRNTEDSIKLIMSEFLSVELVCSKEFLDIFHIALSRHYDACPAGECLPAILSRTVRISAVHDDLKNMPLYKPFKSHVTSCGFAWAGLPL